MVTLRIINLDLGSKVTHDATDWQVATDPLFEDVILESREDEKNLTFISWDKTLDPTVKYYARARALLSTGYTIWGNIDTFKPYDINDVEIDIERPTKVTNPMIDTGHDVNKHPLSLFNITLSNFSAISSATLEASTYLITDIEGNILYHNEYDRINKTNIRIDRLLLKPNTAYRIKCAFKASSGDISDFATKTIVTHKESVVTLKTALTNVKSNEDLTLLLNQVLAVASSQWELYVITDNKVIKVWDTDTDSPYEVSIGNTFIEKDNKYMLRYRCNLDNDDVWNYETFYVYE